MLIYVDVVKSGYTIDGAAGTERVLVKKESTAALVRKQQARQQASLASVFERDLALQRAAAVKGQENSEQAAVMGHLADELAALTKIHEPIKGRAGMCSLHQSIASHQLGLPQLCGTASCRWQLEQPLCTRTLESTVPIHLYQIYLSVA